jgi:hypothetical protein
LLPGWRIATAMLLPLWPRTTHAGKRWFPAVVLVAGASPSCRARLEHRPNRKDRWIPVFRPITSRRYDQMRMPGFTAEVAMRGISGRQPRFAFDGPGNSVRPALMILVDGVPYCEGEVTDWGVQCYGGGGGGGGGGGLGPGYYIACRKACRAQCRNKLNSPCYKNCVADC